ncbi:MAG: prepilin-type N-terminal cleavage/methylation domain-containing protein [Lentisphaeria bacterium]|nr:prepilin-type N-terminal cleavage/methylation domain-containing protein [Lentisphaeria bacterium]
MTLKRSFTLIEVIVVLVIIMLLTGVAVMSLRGESPAAALERNALEVEAFLARVRFLCAESGRDYVVRLYPDKKMFCAHADYNEEELQELEKDITESPASEKFVFPEDMEVFTVDEEDSPAEHDYVELFRFYPTGGAVCLNRPGIRMEELARFFDISFFSGQVICLDGDGSGEEKR